MSAKCQKRTSAIRPQQPGHSAPSIWHWERTRGPLVRTLRLEKALTVPGDSMDTNVRQSLRILVVEDEWIVRAVIANFLRDEGYIVVEAATGEEALSLLTGHNEPIDLLFTDIQLGGRLTGWDVAETFRNSRPHSPVFYASGHPPDDRRRVLGSVFFGKPYLPDKILRACRSLEA
jgi:CheY-like chemotaxis protein